jgi:NAD(P)-dependent dehydrogenase (short-subunit alcohol dehydrogenase family)
MDRFKGKSALVVGGGWGGPDEYAIGIGGAICEIFAREGGKVAVMDIIDDNAERTLRPIKKQGGEAFKIVADTAKEADCKRAVDEVVKKYGKIDILINNVGVGTAGAGYDPDSQEAWDRVMNVNFRGQFIMSKEAVPHMPRGGAIVNVGSVFGAIDPIPGGYAVSKRAVSLVLTPTLAAQYAPQGIRVNCVSVGYVWNAVTQLVQDRQAPGSSMEDYRKGRTAVLTALGIEGDGWDVANAVAFLASDKARWITGQDLMVDGGYGVLNVFDYSPYGRNLATTR